MNKYGIMLKALDEWCITREVVWDNSTKRVVFLTDENTDISKIDGDNVTYYPSYANWATKFLNGDLR